MAQIPAPEYLLTMNRFPGDGVTTIFNFVFTGGYLARDHVKAYIADAETRVVKRTQIVTNDDFIGPYQLRILPAVAADEILVIYRDTPKDEPLVDFTDGAILNEINLDKNAKQAVFLAAEAFDRVSTAVVDSTAAAVAALAAAERAEAAAILAETVVGNIGQQYLSWRNQYQGPKATAPTLRPDGTALQQGDLYFDTTRQSLRVWGTGGWQSVIQGQLKRPPGNTPVVATEGQTTFAVAGGFDPNYGMVFLNGVHVAPPTITLASGINIVFAQALAAGDEVDYVFFGAFDIANATPAPGSVNDTAVSSISSTKIQHWAPGATGPIPVADALNRCLSPFSYGGVGDGVANDLNALRLCAAQCVLHNVGMDLTGGTWRIKLGATDSLDLLNVTTIHAVFSRPILVERTANAEGVWAVTGGTPTDDSHTGRTTAMIIAGSLSLVSVGNGTTTNGRSYLGNGAYFKGSWFNVGHVHADNFNGVGVSFDSVWDGTFGRLRTERCGNINSYSLAFYSSNDTTNCIHIESLQCESAYHKGIYAKILRSVITNIHAERLIVMTANDGAPTALGYLNHYFEIANSTITQAIIHAAPVGTVADDGVTVAVADMISMIGYFDASSARDFIVSGDVLLNGGKGGQFDNFSCRNLGMVAPAGRMTFTNLVATNVSAYENVTFINPYIMGEFNPAYFAAELDVIGGFIYSFNCTNTVRGGIRVRGTQINTLGDVRANLGGFARNTFTDCYIYNCLGGYDASALIRGGTCENVSLLSQTKFDFEGVEGTTFNLNGNLAATTDEKCHWTTVTAWNLPLNRLMRKGSITVNPVYTSGQPWRYVNTDGGATWAPLTVAP